MAYASIDALGFAPVILHRAARAQAEPARFAPLEWLVIALAQRDHSGSLRRPGRFAKAMTALFGTSRETPLAEPRLEALRRFAVIARLQHGQPSAEETAAFLRAGFSAPQADLLVASVTGARA